MEQGGNIEIDITSDVIISILNSLDVETAISVLKMVKQKMVDRLSDQSEELKRQGFKLDSQRKTITEL